MFYVGGSQYGLFSDLPIQRFKLFIKLRKLRQQLTFSL